MLKSKKVADKNRSELGKKNGKEKQEDTESNGKKEASVGKFKVGTFSKLKNKFSKKEFSVGNILNTKKIRSEPAKFIGENIMIMAYYYPGGSFSGKRDYLSSEKIDFDKKEELYKYASQILTCTKPGRTKSNKKVEKGKQYLVKGVLEETESKRFFGSLFLKAERFDQIW